MPIGSAGWKHVVAKRRLLFHPNSTFRALKRATVGIFQTMKSNKYLCRVSFDVLPHLPRWSAVKHLPDYHWQQVPKMYPGKQILEYGTVGQQGKLLLGTPAFPHWRDWSDFPLMLHITAVSVRTPVTQIGDLDGAPGFSLWPLHYLGSQSADGGSLFLPPLYVTLSFKI